MELRLYASEELPFLRGELIQAQLSPLIVGYTLARESRMTAYPSKKRRMMATKKAAPAAAQEQRAE